MIILYGKMLFMIILLYLSFLSLPRPRIFSFLSLARTQEALKVSLV
jgi:hypothetical protein